MDPQYISLATLVKNAQVYERIPAPIQKGLKNSLIFTLVFDLIILPILLFIPPILNPVSNQGFFFLTYGIINWLIFLFKTASIFLFWGVLVSLCLVFIVLVATAGLNQPARQFIHALACFSAFPTGVTAVSLAFLLFIFSALFIFTLILWILIIAFAIWFAIWVTGEVLKNISGG